MTRMIPVVDLTSGRVTQRPSNTPTFDLPEDFDRGTAAADLDDRSRAHYSSNLGKPIIRPVMARPLSWRVRGEECLVADGTRAPTSEHPSNYKLCAIER
jgi:hypothetical protein